MEQLNQKHYICLGGCKGVSLYPGVCQAEDCANHNHNLVECNCTDDLHFDFKACVNCEKLCAGDCNLQVSK